MSLPHIRFNHETQRYYAQGIPERALSPPQTGFELTTDETNAVQAEVEQRASDECDNCDDRFRDWLNSKAGDRTRQDYAQYRAAMLTDDEQIAIETELGIRPCN